MSDTLHRQALENAANISRRGVLLGAGLGAAALAAGGLGLGGCAATGASASAQGSAPPSARRRVSRLCHFTDSHIRPEFNAVEGVAAAMAAVTAERDRPDRVIFGGDMIMHSMDQTEQRTRELWSLWTKATAALGPIPTHYCLGNHDIWGWDKAASKSTGNEPLWGKRWALDIQQASRTYSSFTLGRTPRGTPSWRVVLLDTISPRENTYEGRLDDEQFEWFAGELKASGAEGSHVMIVTHIPILSISMVAVDARHRAEGLVLGRGAMMMDVLRILELLRAHPNVRLCVSGHIHTLDRIEYEGVTYVCNGAVSGGWWRTREANIERSRGRMQPGDPDPATRPARAQSGYTLIDLFDDGTFENTYRPFGWKPV